MAALVPGSNGGVEINQLHQRIFREARNPLFEIVKLESLLAALHELNNLAAHQIDRGDQHGHLTETP